MKILVTGGCGFLGSHVCELFKGEGWDVISYDNLTKFEYKRTGYNVDLVRDYNLKYLEALGVPTIIEDIRNLKTLSKVAKGCDLIAHCAAQPAMTVAIEDPKLDFEVNIQGTLNVLDAALQANKIPVVNCSTIHVYGTGINRGLIEREDRFHREPEAIDENAPLLTGELTPLHISKRVSEINTETYTRLGLFPTASFRLTGIYGPRQFGGEDHGWVANFAIRTILDNPIKVFGTDKQVRDVLYVKDAAQAFLDWYKADCPTGVYNIGGGPSCILSIKKCLSLLRETTGKDQILTLEPWRFGDLYYFVSDTRKANWRFGWVPTMRPREGLKELVEWIRENLILFKEA